MAIIRNGRAIQLMLKHAAQCRADAGMNGEHHDGGAGSIEAQVEAFRAGLLGNVPDIWKTVLIKMTREENPEWKEYLRLKAMFEAK